MIVGAAGLSVRVGAGGTEMGGVDGAPHPTKNSVTSAAPMICCNNFCVLIVLLPPLGEMRALRASRLTTSMLMGERITFALTNWPSAN